MHEAEVGPARRTRDLLELNQRIVGMALDGPYTRRRADLRESSIRTGLDALATLANQEATT